MNGEEKMNKEDLILDADERIKILQFLWKMGYPRYGHPSLIDTALLEKAKSMGYTNEL